MFLLHNSYMLAFIGSLMFSNILHAQDWTIAGKRGMMTFIVISKDREKDENVYMDAIKKICNDGGFCKIMFWSNIDDVPKSWPMTDHERNSKIADYYYNGNSGEVKFIFKFSSEN